MCIISTDVGLFVVLKLLKSPGKDCPRFRALMTETFESEHYQRFLGAHQVGQTIGGDGMRCNSFLVSVHSSARVKHHFPMIHVLC